MVAPLTIIAYKTCHAALNALACMIVSKKFVSAMFFSVRAERVGQGEVCWHIPVQPKGKNRMTVSGIDCF